MLLTVWDKKDIHSPSPPLSMCGGKKISEMENALRVLPRRHSTKIGRGEERKHRAVWRWECGGNRWLECSHFDGEQDNRVHGEVDLAGKRINPGTSLEGVVFLCVGGVYAIVREG